MYGWYLDGYELGEGSSEDPYKVIQMAVDAVASSSKPWQIGLIRVGELKTQTPSENLDAHGIKTAWADGSLTAESITDWLVETSYFEFFAWETVQRLERTLATALTAATEANVVEVVHRWADSEIGERVWCDGRDALPVEHDGDEWHRGVVMEPMGGTVEPRASVDIWFDDEGIMHWEWVALAPGQEPDAEPSSGMVESLAEAMDAAARVVRGIE